MTTPLIEVGFAQTFLDDLKRLKKKFRHVFDDVDEFVDLLKQGETSGDQIPGVGSPVYKVRLKSRDLAKGKRSGFRTLYYVETPTRRVLLTIYIKSERADISIAEIARIVKQYLSQDQ